jgi:hypothetical protein
MNKFAYFKPQVNHILSVGDTVLIECSDSPAESYTMNPDVFGGVSFKYKGPVYLRPAEVIQEPLPPSAIRKTSIVAVKIQGDHEAIYVGFPQIKYILKELK